MLVQIVVHVLQMLAHLVVHVLQMLVQLGVHVLNSGPVAVFANLKPDPPSQPAVILSRWPHRSPL